MVKVPRQMTRVQNFKAHSIVTWDLIGISMAENGHNWGLYTLIGPEEKIGDGSSKEDKKQSWQAGRQGSEELGNR